MYAINILSKHYARNLSHCNYLSTLNWNFIARHESQICKYLLSEETAEFFFFFDNNRVNFFTISTLFRDHQKTIKKTRGVRKRKTSRKTKNLFSLRNTDQSHSRGLSFISKHSFLFLRTTFFTQIKHAKSIKENIARLKPRLVFSSFELTHSSFTRIRKFIRSPTEPTVKSTRQEKNVWSIKRNLMPKEKLSRKLKFLWLSWCS